MSVTRYALAQSVTEITLGSLIHAFHIPLGGHLLSLNQAILLTLSTKSISNRRSAVTQVTQIANTTAILKALSPIGNRITPMLAISVQGLLFSSGVGLLGVNLAGIALGSALLSVWSFLQPLLIASFIFGGVFLEAVTKLWGDTSRIFGIPSHLGVQFLLGIVFVKILIAVIVSWIAWRAGDEFENQYFNQLNRFSGHVNPQRKPARTPLQGAFKDLFHPGYFGAALLSFGFFILVGKPSLIQILIYAFRVVGGALLVFWAFRAIPRAWITLFLQKFPQLNYSVHQVLDRLSRT